MLKQLIKLKGLTYTISLLALGTILNLFSPDDKPESVFFLKFVENVQAGVLDAYPDANIGVWYMEDLLTKLVNSEVYSQINNVPLDRIFFDDGIYNANSNGPFININYAIYADDESYSPSGGFYASPQFYSRESRTNVQHIVNSYYLNNNLTNGQFRRISFEIRHELIENNESKCIPVDIIEITINENGDVNSEIKNYMIPILLQSPQLYIQVNLNDGDPITAEQSKLSSSSIAPLFADPVRACVDYYRDNYLETTTDHADIFDMN